MYKLTYNGRSMVCYSRGCSVLTLALLLGEQRAPMASEDILVAEAADLVQSGRASIIEATDDEARSLPYYMSTVGGRRGARPSAGAVSADFENRIPASELPPASPHYQTTTAERLATDANYQPSIQAVETPPVPGELTGANTSSERETTEADVENAEKEAGGPVLPPSGDIDEVFEEEFDASGEPIPPLPVDSPPEAKLMASHNRKGKRR